MRSLRAFGLQFVFLISTLSAWAADPPKLLRSVSGPSGKSVGSDFILDETRNRFVYPADKSFVIYFQWEAPPGDHVLTGIWKQPGGSIASISPDVKVQTTTSALNSYWIFELTPRLPNGIWTLEVRVDGQPSGSHPFEIAGMEAQASQPSVDQVFKAVAPSLVWIRKLDPGGRRSDAATGFVIQPGSVATAFQAIDSAKNLEIEFADGHKIQAHKVAAFSRLGDWAILDIDTGSLAPIPRGDPAQVPVGGRLLAFNVDSNVRVIGGVDIGSRNGLPGFGTRIQFAPAVVSEAIGGPLLDLSGRVVGILGGSVTPGARVEQRLIKSGQGLSALVSAANAATAISDVREPTGESQLLDELDRKGVLTPMLNSMPEFLYGGTVKSLPKRADEPLPPDVPEFSQKDAFVYVYSYWKREGKTSKGEMSAKVYDVENYVRAAVKPKKVTLREESMRFSFGFVPNPLKPGIYRIDLLWDGRAAWRTFIRVSE